MKESIKVEDFQKAAFVTLGRLMGVYKLYNATNKGQSVRNRPIETNLFYLDQFLKIAKEYDKAELNNYIISEVK